MKIYKLCTLVLIGLGMLALQGCPGPDEKKTAKVSYAYEDLSKATPEAVLPSGSSTIENLVLASEGGMTFNSSKKGWEMQDTESKPVEFSVVLQQPTTLQVAMEVKFEEGTSPSSNKFYAVVNNHPKMEFSALESFNYETNLVALQIPESYTYKEGNSVKIYEVYDNSASVLVHKVMFLPQKVISSDGVLTTTLYTQFGETDLVKGTNIAGAIWTRAYGLSETMEMIPGPTLYYNPGDLLEVNLKNQLNPATSQALTDYQKLQESIVNTDEELAGDAVRGEINIPHNLNNTNLHVHGLHVDPSKDDVTIVIVPEGESTKDYDAPMQHHPVDKVKDLNEFSVSDQSVKKGDWVYQYRIPENHLPGTHWFHPHKHGATSAQVENGLAGTMVIMENKTNAIVPYPGEANSVDIGKGTQTNYNLEDWRGIHDRVLAIQEITNFGLQRGKGNTLGKIDSIANLGNRFGNVELTVNGIDSLAIKIGPGQLERWRLVNAGTNHRAFSHVWLGKSTGDTISSKAPDGKVKRLPVFESADMYMVATDGITHSRRRKVTAERPALLAPGNRTDFLVQLSDTGKYVLFKNYHPPKGLALISSTNNKDTLYKTTDKTTNFNPARLAAIGKDDAYLFPKTGTTQENYMGFQRQWNESIKTPKTPDARKSIVPIIKVTPDENRDGKFLELDFKVAKDFQVNSTGFTPVNHNDGTISDGELMWIHVTGDTISGNGTPAFPSDEHLARISPAAPQVGLTPPPYASPVTNEDILQSRPVVFDVSGMAVNVTNEKDTTKSLIVNQFTLNGRFFILNDPIGNTHANSDHITRGYTDPSELESGRDQKNIGQKLEFVPSRPVQWNSNKSDGKWYFVNPGYYQDIIRYTLEVDGKEKSVFDYSGKGTPTWEAVSGIPNDAEGNPQMAIVNPDNVKAASNTSKGYIPGLPIATTAEEWILVNNSDVGHPFHIHINPFFIVEVGQLGYENYKDADGNTKSDWFMRAVTAEGGDWPQRDAKPSKGAQPGSIYKGNIEVDGIVGNWWDTIVIPAHGYVKVRYWMNVPEQNNSKNLNDIMVTDDVNRTGIWVYHCHILRHEDRGMMMPVITRPGAE